jgi:3-dehydroquinate dehydratase
MLVKKASARMQLLADFQSNHEGALIVDAIHDARGKSLMQSLLMPALMSHYSYCHSAMLLALCSMGLKLKYILSNPYAREEHSARLSLISPAS